MLSPFLYHLPNVLMMILNKREKCDPWKVVRDSKEWVFPLVVVFLYFFSTAFFFSFLIVAFFFAFSFLFFWPPQFTFDGFLNRSIKMNKLTTAIFSLLLWFKFVNLFFFRAVAATCSFFAFCFVLFFLHRSYPLFLPFTPQPFMMTPLLHRDDTFYPPSWPHPFSL